MINRIKQDIENLNKQIDDNNTNMNKLFELLDKINEQASEVQLKIENLQLDNQNSQNEINTLGIVKDYLERVEEENKED